MAQNERLIKKLNLRLAAELGRTPSGEGLYRWQWSEGWMHPMRVIDSETGQPKFNYRCGCGLNRAVHTPACGTLIVAEPVYEPRKILPSLKRQWAVALWCPPLPEPLWRREFGSALQYPANGYLVPVGGGHGGVIAIQPDLLPDLDVTNEFIFLVREQRKKSFADHLAEGNAGLAAIEKHDDDRLADMIAEECTAFGAIPGSKSGGVSFPSIARP